MSQREAELMVEAERLGAKLEKLPPAQQKYRLSFDRVLNGKTITYTGDYTLDEIPAQLADMW